MTAAKSYCLSHEPIAYWSGLGGFEVHGIEHEIDDYVYAVSGAWAMNKDYHRLKVNYNRSGEAYVTCSGVRVPLGECIRMGA